MADDEQTKREEQRRVVDDALKSISDKSLAVILDQIFKDGDGMNEKMDGMNEKMDGMCKNIDNLRKGQDGMNEKMDGMNEKMDGMNEKMDGMCKNIELLLTATPAAAPIPKVFVAGSTEKAQLTGASATWTVVKAKECDLNRPSSTTTSSSTVAVTVSPDKDQVNKKVKHAYFLVSCLHCIRRIRDATDENNVISLISICEDAAKFFELNPSSLVELVGFHKQLGVNGKKFLPSVDLVFLKLNGKPSEVSEDEFEIPEIIPIIDKHSDFAQQNVSGTALSGRVNGTGLQYNAAVDQKCFSFLLKFAEKGTSGTVLFARGAGVKQQQALGCFRGSNNAGLDLEHGTHVRGTIVPFPQWGDISWIECNARPLPYEGTMLTLTCGRKMEGPVKRDGCPMYLPIGRCNREYDFTGKQNDASNDDNEDQDDDC